MTRVHTLLGLSNREFFARHGRPGRVGVVGGSSTVDKGIRLAQKAVTPDGRPSPWSHAFLFEGERIDGESWVIESDLEFRPSGIRTGVQENRVVKYEDDGDYANVAVLDFGLEEAKVRAMLKAGLDLLAHGTRYAVGGLFETWFAIVRKQVGHEKKKDSTFCSSFVRTLLMHVGVDLAPGVAVRHTTPHHVAVTEAAVTRWELARKP